MVIEHRRFPRTRPSVLIPVQLGENNGGMVLDLSEGGACVRAVRPLARDLVCPLEFVLRGRELRLKAQGQVAWVDNSGTRGGVRFFDLPADTLQQIHEWLAAGIPVPHLKPQESSSESGVAEREQAATADETAEETRKEEEAGWGSPWRGEDPVEKPAPAQESPVVPLFSTSPPISAVLDAFRPLPPPCAPVSQKLERSAPSAETEEEPRSWAPTWDAGLPSPPMERPLRAGPSSSATTARARVLEFAGAVTPVAGTQHASVPGVAKPAIAPSPAESTLPTELQEPWQKKEVSPQPVRRDPHSRREQIVRAIRASVLVAAAIAATVLFLSYKEVIGVWARSFRAELAAELGISRPRRIRLPIPAPAKSTADSRGRSPSKIPPGVPSRASAPGAASNHTKSLAVPAQAGPAEFEVQGPDNERKLIPFHSGPVVWLHERTTVARIRAQRVGAADISGKPPDAQAGGSTAGNTLEISGLLPERSELPGYPPLALQNDVKGAVVLRALIAADGTVQDVRLISGPPLLAPAVMDAVRTWRYKPHFRDGKPVPVETHVVVEFSISTK